MFNTLRDPLDEDNVKKMWVIIMSGMCLEIRVVVFEWSFVLGKYWSDWYVTLDGGERHVMELFLSYCVSTVT